MNTQIEIAGLTVRYDSVLALENISYTIHRGDFIGITGPNGGGKTTLLRTLLGLKKPDEGAIRFYRDGQPVVDLNVGYLPQKSVIDPRFPITVAEVVESGFLGKYGDVVPKQCRGERIKEVLARVGLSGLSDKTIGKLSGGQMQRALLGRALVALPEVLVLDEPSSYVDQSFEERMHEMLRDENKRGTTILYVSHQTEILNRMAGRMVHIDRVLQELR